MSDSSVKEKAAPKAYKANWHIAKDQRLQHLFTKKEFASTQTCICAHKEKRLKKEKRQIRLTAIRALTARDQHSEILFYSINVD